jgi:flavodoxin
MKTLVAFYSLDGNTRYIAETIAKQLHADLLEIKPKKEYPSQGFMKYFLGGKSAIFKECPKLTNQNINLSDYQNIIIGTPIWAGSYSAPINSFIKQNKIKNKSIALFACHASNEVDAAKKCYVGLKKRLAENTFVGEIDFIDPLKHNKEDDLNKAAKWSASLNF